MKKHTFLVWCLLGLLMTAQPGLAFQIGMPAPDFELSTFEDDPLDLKGLLDEDKPLLLVFWTTWCPYCKKEMTAINELYEASESKNLTIVGINAGWNDSVPRAKAFQDRYDIRFPLAFDHENRVSRDYMIRGVPSLVLVDGQGTIAYRGHVLNPELKDMIAKLLEG
jgi:peroxiredoxin